MRSHRDGKCQWKGSARAGRNWPRWRLVTRGKRREDQEAEAQA